MRTKVIIIFSSLITLIIILSIASSIQTNNILFITHDNPNNNIEDIINGISYAAGNTPLEDPVIPNPDFVQFTGYVFDTDDNPIFNAVISIYGYNVFTGENEFIGNINIISGNYFDILLSVLIYDGYSFTASADGYYSSSTYFIDVSSNIIFNLRSSTPPPSPPPPTKQLVP